MKKLLLGLAASAFMFGVSMANSATNIIAIDSIEIMQKSKEGKQLSEEVQKKITDYQNFVKHINFRRFYKDY
jgi:Skp family chaperone for outer membrane proteins